MIKWSRKRTEEPTPGRHAAEYDPARDVPEVESAEVDAQTMFELIENDPYQAEGLDAEADAYLAESRWSW